MQPMILVINPGSTSTKVALYSAEQPLWNENIKHERDVIASFPTIYSQLDMRYETVSSLLREKQTDLGQLCAVVARGGLLQPVPSGAFLVNDLMLDTLEHHPINHHASNLGAAIAYRIAQPLGIPAYIYDPVTVDEMDEVARLTGLREVRRFGQGHNLNMRAAALRYCREKQVDYKSVNLLVAHLGGGITMSLHSHGRIIDFLSDDDGAFSPERAGEIPTYKLINLIFDHNYTKEEIYKKLQRAGGLQSHLGTTDACEVEARIAANDQYADLVYEAMALNVARGLARLSVMVNGAVDAIILTGSIAYSADFTQRIQKRISFIAPVAILAGENEMQALAEGALRVLRGEETARDYTPPTDNAGGVQ